MQKIPAENWILHEKFVLYGKNAKEWMRKCVLLLPEIAGLRIWQQKGFGSIYEYAGKLAGMTRDQVNEGLRVLEKIADKPELQKVVEEKGINAIKPVIAIANIETSAFWAEKAMTMSKNTLETYVKEMRKQNSEIGLPRKAENAENPHQQAIENFENTETATPKVTIMMQLDPELADQLQKLKGDNEWNDLMQELLKLREQKLEEQKPERVRTESRHITNKIQAYVLARTNGRCAYPSCLKLAEIFHHLQRWALDHVHDPDQIVALCKAHERLAHHGLIENEECSTDCWKVQAESDRNKPKYKVDQLVAKYRTPK